MNKLISLPAIERVNIQLNFDALLKLIINNSQSIQYCLFTHKIQMAGGDCIECNASHLITLLYDNCIRIDDKYYNINMCEDANDINGFYIIINEPAP